MWEIVQLVFKIVDGLTWPFRVAAWWAFALYIEFILGCGKMIIWVLTLPLRTIGAAINEGMVRKRLQGLQVEFDRLTDSVQQLETKLENERERHWHTVEKLQKSLNQRRFLKQRVQSLEAEISELRAARAQAEEKAQAAKEAEAIAEADVMRAGRLLSHYLEKREGVVEEIEVEVEAPSASQRTSLLPDEEQEEDREDMFEGGAEGEEGGGEEEGEVVGAAKGVLGSLKETKFETFRKTVDTKTPLSEPWRPQGKGALRRPLAFSSLLCALMSLGAAFLHGRNEGRIGTANYSWLFFSIAFGSLASNWFIFGRKSWSKAVLIQNLMWALFGLFLAMVYFSVGEGTGASKDLAVPLKGNGEGEGVGVGGVLFSDTNSTAIVSVG